MKRTATTLTRAKILKALDNQDDMLRKYSVKRIGLFGSHARNQPRRGSDIDFLVEFEKPTYDNLYDLSVSLERLFRRKIELVTSPSAHVRPFIEREIAWHEVR